MTLPTPKGGVGVMLLRLVFLKFVNYFVGTIQ